jgi:GNAT superfamily N-acetyltransferase
MPSHYRTGSESIEIAARRSFFAAAPASFGCDVFDLPGTSAALLRVAAMPSPIMNRVVGLPGDAALDDVTLARITQRFRERDIRQFWVHVWDGPGNEALRDSLLARGFQPQGSWAKFVCELDGFTPQAPSSGLTVRRAGKDEFGLAGQILCDSFGMPPVLVPWMAGLDEAAGWQVYFACDAQGVPIATGALLVDGPNAWLGMGATLPAARRQGSQQMLMAVRLAAAKAAGCVIAAVEADALVQHSINNIQRAGFLPEGARSNYLCPVNFTV